MTRMTTTHILLIRHGETDWNRSGRWQGLAPIPLNEDGREQARRLAAYLAACEVMASAIYSSDLSRCRETAAIIASRLNKALHLDPRLREIDLGQWQGLTAEEIRFWDGTAHSYREADRHHRPFPGGESPHELAVRACAALDHARVNHAGGEIVIVTHGGVIRNIVRHLGLLAEPPPPANTSLWKLAYNDDGWQLVYSNRIDHLAPDAHLAKGGEG